MSSRFKPITDINILRELLDSSSGKPLIALDIGKSRIGVAVSDSRRMIANPHDVIQNRKFTSSAEEIFKIYDEYAAAAIIVGLPIHISGDESKMSQYVRQFAVNLLKSREVKVFLEDERFSSKIAEEAMEQAGLSALQQKDKVDKIAASVILQTTLDRLKVR